MPATSTLTNLSEFPPNIEDQVLYEELLAIHSAILLLAATSSSAETPVPVDFIAKFLAIRHISASTTFNLTDNVIIAAATTSNVVVTLPDASTCVGYEFTLKARVITLPYTITLMRAGTSLIDGSVSISLSPLDSITVKSDGANWWII